MNRILFSLLSLAILSIPITADALTDEEFFHIQRAQRKVDCVTVKAGVTSYDGQHSNDPQTKNGDETLYPDLRGSFGKALNHLNSCYINPAAFSSLINALQTGTIQDFNNILMGTGPRKLVSPQTSFAYCLSANDTWVNAIPPAPAFASAETAGEMVEVYWTALIRDVPFNMYESEAMNNMSMVAMAIKDLNDLSDFRGPKIGGDVTAKTLLRGNTPGDLIGPYISQFLYQTIPYGQTTIPPEMTVPLPGKSNDFNTSLNDWKIVINGGLAANSTVIDSTKHFIRNARDLAEVVHSDFPGQEPLNAALLMINDPHYGTAALDPNNPYINNPTQEAFVAYGLGHLIQLIFDATVEGLKTAWYQKWQVNRRLRPEEYGFYVQEQLGPHQVPLGIHSDLTSSKAVQEILNCYTTYLLPQAYPEGSPTHPSYPAGHATFIGAAVTILKAFFNENFVIPHPLMPEDTGVDKNKILVAYTGPALTFGGELNKLAANISLGRDHAGVHYRSDGIQGIFLGEKVAIDVLNHSSFLFNEDFEGFTLTKFDGTTIQVGAKQNAL